MNKTEALKLALEALKGGLWDYGPGQDEHQRCNEVIAICEAALAEQPAQQDPFGYFKPEPFGWTDCAETDEGAIALYERPPASKPWVVLSEEDYVAINQACLTKMQAAASAEAILREKNA